MCISLSNRRNRSRVLCKYNNPHHCKEKCEFTNTLSKFIAIDDIIDDVEQCAIIRLKKYYFPYFERITIVFCKKNSKTLYHVCD